ncbi:MAG: alpha-glucosidase, partial [Bryobacteraceae bacterium]
DNSWWQHAIIYEIYPRSFADTNGDGIGDLNGITKHLDYLADLGVDAIWITPFYPSPQVDFGYDISNYRGIDPQYGTMADFDRLVAEAHKRNIRIVTDLVLNHTSDKHPWFIESASSRTNPKADWYVWEDGKGPGHPPNNWQSLFGHSAWQWDPRRRQFYYHELSLFGHSAWQWDPRRRQFYYHEFYKQQPDLNWRNPDVRAAMYDAVRFWLKHGVAGFRLDAITCLFEDPQLRDERVVGGPNAFGDPIVSREYTDNLPEVHDVLRELRKVTDEFTGRVLIGETYVNSIQDLARMYGAHDDELQLPMDTQLGFVDRISAVDFRRLLNDAETGLTGNMPLFVFDNHDRRRSWDRFADGVHDAVIARLIATLLLTPRCAALVYYGQELGMENNDPQRKEDVRDPIGITGWPKDKGRDGERTPMQWNDLADAGFSTAASTWLPVAPDYKERNVVAERHDPNSLLNFYKALIRLRKENSALRDGDFELVNATDHNVLSYMRKAADGTEALVVLNCSVSPQTESFDVRSTQAVTLVSSFAKTGRVVDLKRVMLPPYGSWVGQLQ